MPKIPVLTGSERHIDDHVVPPPAGESRRFEPYESTIEVEFHPSGDRARMVVTLHPHRDPHWTKMSVEGFRSQLTKLDKRFGGSGQ